MFGFFMDCPRRINSNKIRTYKLVNVNYTIKSLSLTSPLLLTHGLRDISKEALRDKEENVLRISKTNNSCGRVYILPNNQRYNFDIICSSYFYSCFSVQLSATSAFVDGKV
jgi:hypothetical protein